jgi:hypothetical protein
VQRPSAVTSSAHVLLSSRYSIPIELVFINIAELPPPSCSLSLLHSPHVSTRVAGSGCGKKRDYVVMQIAWACVSFAGVDTGVVGGSTVDKRHTFFICRRRSGLCWRQPDADSCVLSLLTHLGPMLPCAHLRSACTPAGQSNLGDLKFAYVHVCHYSLRILIIDFFKHV